MIVDKADFHNGTNLLSYLLRTNITGASGLIRFDANGDPLGCEPHSYTLTLTRTTNSRLRLTLPSNYDLLNFQDMTGNLTRVARYQANTLGLLTQPVWSTVDNSVPVDAKTEPSAIPIFLEWQRCGLCVREEIGPVRCRRSQRHNECAEFYTHSQSTSEEELHAAQRSHWHGRGALCPHCALGDHRAVPSPVLRRRGAEKQRRLRVVTRGGSLNSGVAPQPTGVPFLGCFHAE